MAQTFFPITPVEVTPDEALKWDICDVSAHIPAGATGVILHCVNTHETNDHNFGLRKNGSTDDRTAKVYDYRHLWAMIGVDGERIFQAYVGSTTEIDIYLVGYTKSGVTFSTNADNKSLGDIGDWYEIDCSSEAPSAIGLIFEVVATTTREFGLRKNGSSDDRHFDTSYHSSFGVVIGCDALQKCQGYIEATTVDFYLVGYITDGVTFNTNATDLSLGSTGAWLDLSALPEGSGMGIIETTNPNHDNYGLRKEGSEEEIYYHGFEHPWAIVECDASRIIEGKIEGTSIDFFLVGHAEGVSVTAPTVTTQAASDVGTTTATGNGNITATGGENCDHRGIVYGKTSKGDPGDTAPGDTAYDDFEDESGDFGTGAFTRSLTGLDSGTKYYARAYAHNSEGYSYGDEVDFTTNKSCQGSDTGSGADAKGSGNPLATLIKAEAGSGVEALLGRALVIGEAGSGLESLSSRIFASAEVGSGAEVSALLAALIGTGETGLGSEFATKIFSVFDSGIGIDAVITRLLAANEAGSALEAALLIIALISGDGGLGSDLGTLLKAILASDEGSGFDARRALIEIPTTGSDMRLPPSPGQAGIPSKEVNL